MLIVGLLVSGNLGSGTQLLEVLCLAAIRRRSSASAILTGATTLVQRKLVGLIIEETSGWVMENGKTEEVPRM